MSNQPGSPQYQSPILRQKFFLTSHKSLLKNQSGSRASQRKNQQSNTIQEYLSQHNSLQKSKTPLFIGSKAIEIQIPSIVTQISPSLQTPQQKKSQRLLSGSRSRTDEGFFEFLMNNNANSQNLQISSSLKNLQGMVRCMSPNQYNYQEHKGSTSQQHGQTIIEYIDSIRKRNASSTIKITSAGISSQSTTNTTQNQNLSTIMKRVRIILNQCQKEKQEFQKREQQMKQEIVDLKTQLQSFKELKYKLCPQSSTLEDKIKANKFIKEKKLSIPLNKIK